MKSKSLLILSALTIGLSSHQMANAGGAEFKITDPDQGHQLFTDAVNKKDIQRILALYADDAIMVAQGNTVITGKPAIRAFFIDALPRIEKIELGTVFRINYKDTVVFRSKYTVTYKTPDGKTVKQSTSGIEVERKQPDGSWLFVVDHHYGGADLAKFQKLNVEK